MPRLCPDCAEPLNQRQIRGLTLDVCGPCGGVYFDEGEMAALQDAGPEALQEVEAAAEPTSVSFVDAPVPKSCPGCSRRMEGYAFRYSSPIRLDGCFSCGGIWVQEGELAKIAEFIEAPALTFGGTPSAYRAAAPRNEESHARDKAARRHADLVQRVMRLMKH